MSLYDDLYNKFDVEHPVIRYMEGNDVLEYSSSEREDVLVEWVNNHINYHMNILRDMRNGFLAKSDWTQVPDAPVDAVAWAEYRQALRDLPDTITSVELLENPVWPTPPE
jgi:hypothetical protein